MSMDQSPLTLVFKEALKFYRKESNLSQQALAEKAGVSVTFLAELEIGRRCPSFPTLEKLANSLGVEPFQLFLSPSTEQRTLLKGTVGDIRLIVNQALDEYQKRLGL